jgi:hypothetical protein
MAFVEFVNYVFIYFKMHIFKTNDFNNIKVDIIFINKAVMDSSHGRINFKIV